MRLPTHQPFNRLKELRTKPDRDWSAIAEAMATTERELAELEKLVVVYRLSLRTHQPERREGAETFGGVEWGNGVEDQGA